MNINKQILNKLAETWDLFMTNVESNLIDDKKWPNTDDVNDFRRAINEAQRIVSTRFLKETHPQFFDGNEDRFLTPEEIPKSVNQRMAEQFMKPFLEPYEEPRGAEYTVPDITGVPYKDEKQDKFHSTVNEGFTDFKANKYLPPHTLKPVSEMSVEEFKELSGRHLTPNSTIIHWLTKPGAMDALMNGMPFDDARELLQRILKAGYTFI